MWNQKSSYTYGKNSHGNIAWGQVQPGHQNVQQKWRQTLEHITAKRKGRNINQTQQTAGQLWYYVYFVCIRYVVWKGRITVKTHWRYFGRIRPFNVHVVQAFDYKYWGKRIKTFVGLAKLRSETLTHDFPNTKAHQLFDVDVRWKWNNCELLPLLS
jgi:hypothetical protein